MQAVAAHALMLVFAAAAARLGWFMVRAPERALRVFTFGAEPAFGKQFGMAWCKAAGWLFTLMGCLGIVLYLVLIPIDLWHAH